MTKSTKLRSVSRLLLKPEENHPIQVSQQVAFHTGSHAAKNVGISIVRANRELELDQSWVDPSDARERWWGIEIEFPPALDEVFGVTNNKQTARYFAQTPDIEALLEEGQSIMELRQQLVEEEDPVGPLVEIAERVRTNLGPIRRLLKAQMRGGAPGRLRHGPDSPEVQGTRETRRRQEEGYAGTSDPDEAAPPEERRDAIQQELVDQGVPPTQAKELAATTVSDGIKFVFNESDLETSAFFSVRPTRRGTKSSR